MILAANFFTPYYILAVAFGAFAVLVSVVGMKKPAITDKFNGLIILIGIAFGIATFAFVWHGGEEEVEHREHEEHESKADEGASTSPNPLPAGLVKSA